MSSPAGAATRPKSVTEVCDLVRGLLASPLDDITLLKRFEELAQERVFDGLTYLWGPPLYRRSRAVFRPFILSHFSNTIPPIKGWRWELVKWKGPLGRDLDAWLGEVDRDNDVELFRRLYQWKHGFNNWKNVAIQWRRDLLARYTAETTRQGRNLVLAKFDLGLYLDELTALELYRHDPDAARAFILKHVSRWLAERTGTWEELRAEAWKRGDLDFHFAIYRRLIDLKRWERDAMELCDRVRDPGELNDELRKRHPESLRGLIDFDLGKAMLAMVRRRGRDVVPYVLAHLRDAWGQSWRRGGYRGMVRLAAENSWWDLWSGLVRVCSNSKEYNEQIGEMLADTGLPDDEIVRRLLMLSGVSREWNFGPFGLAQVKQLTDDTAVRLYHRFPDLLRGPFKMHVSFGWFGPLPKLTARALDAEDETLIDYLASRAVTWANWGYDRGQVAVCEQLSRYYERLAGDPQGMARRAVNVLGQVPAFSVFSYDQLVRTNRLARLLFERSASIYLEEPALVRDLLESPAIQVQILALKVLALDDDRARRTALETLDLLQATLLRPLHRKTRLVAFDALANAAADGEAARRIHDRARQALDLPDKRYPKEELIGLIGRILHRHPSLRTEREQPVVYQGAARR